LPEFDKTGQPEITQFIGITAGPRKSAHNDVFFSQKYGIFRPKYIIMILYSALADFLGIVFALPELVMSSAAL